MSGLRRGLKRAAEAALGSTALAGLSDAWLSGQRLVLAYHNVLPPGGPPEGDRSLHCAFDRFRAHLDLLQARHEVRALDELLTTGTSQPTVALTFDDAYAGALLVALPELASRGIPATVFVTPGLLGLGTPWWDAISDEMGLPDAVRRDCLENQGGVTARVVEWARGNGRSVARSGDAARIATEEELVRAAAVPGVTLAAHSWSHPNLVRCDDTQLRAELDGTLPWLTKRFGGLVRKWLAYPYGLSDGRVREATRAAGYEAAFAVSGGWHRKAGDRFAIPRLNVPAGLSTRGLAARLSGFLGA